jgi:hypothetical protein
MNNIYEEALAFFLQQGKEIEGVSDLIVRGTSKDTKNCTPHWSDIDVSIITKKINIEIYDQVRNLYAKMRKKFPFKISITFVSESDFLSYRHHHGMKPIYYNFILQSPHMLQDKKHQFNEHNINELKYDCFYNIVYLMHNLRIEDMKRDSDLFAMQEFCCQLLKSSNHLIRNSIFIKTGCIQEKINTKLFKTCFPNIDHDFSQKLMSFKKNWPHIFESYNDLMQIRKYVLPIISEIYDQMVEYFSNLNYKIIVLSNTQDLTVSQSAEIGKELFPSTPIQHVSRKT